MARDLNLPGKKLMLGSARLWKRVIAFLVDLIIIDFVLFFPFKNLLEKLIPAIDLSSFSAALQSTQPSPALIVAMLGMVLILILYFTLLEFKVKQTLGKIVMNLTVSHVDPSQELKFWQCFVRTLFVIPVFPFALLMFFDPIYVFFNSSKQRLLEVISKTKTSEMFIMIKPGESV